MELEDIMVFTKVQTLVPILSQLISVHIYTIYLNFSKIHFNIILLSRHRAPKKSLVSRFFN